MKLMEDPHRRFDGVQDACDRLSRAVLGYSSAHAQKLTRRIAASNFFLTNQDPPSKEKIVSQLRGLLPSRVEEVLSLVEELEEICSNKYDQLPRDLMLVYTELLASQERRRRLRAGRTHEQPTHPTILDRNPSGVGATYEPPTLESIQQSEATKEMAQTLEMEESFVLRECLYALQGIGGDRIQWVRPDGEFSSDDVEKVIAIHIPWMENVPPSLMISSKLGSGAKDAISICTEAGWLCNRVENYIQRREQHHGSIVRAFVNQLNQEMHSYKNTLAALEEKQPQSLRQILAEIRAPITRLRTIAMVTDGVKIITGAKLLTSLHLHSLHGDSRHSALLHSLLDAASRPWFEMLYTWTTEGILMDPHDEFFIRENTNKKNEHANFWREKYNVDQSKIPEGVADKEMIESCFILGKGINFIRKCLLDNSWVNGSMGKEEVGFHYIDASSEAARRRSYIAVQKQTLQVHSHILDSLRTKYNLKEHLHGLKQFLLLGQGDFFSNLVDSLHQEYADHQGIVGIYRHTLSAIVDGSIKSTNASHLSDIVLDRLQVELKLDRNDDTRFMFGHSKSSRTDERTVWDIFTLDYSLPEPLKAIVYEEVMTLYTQLFDFLFSFKRVEFMLNQTWRESAVLQHALQRTAQYNGLSVQNSKEYAQATILLRRIAMARQAMSHFVGNYKSYMMFEVLEGGWNEFDAEINVASTLDDLIRGHENYIHNLARRSLMDMNRSGRRLCILVHRQIEVVREFCFYQQKLFSEAIDAADRVAAKRAEAERRLDDGDWGFQSEQDIAEEHNFFGLSDFDKLDKVDSFGNMFDTNMVLILEALNQELHTGSAILETETHATPVSRTSPITDIRDDQDALRFLTFQLNHNHFYETQER